MFKVGDKVKTKAETGYACTFEGDTGVVTDASPDLISVKPDTADWDGCNTLSFYPHEIELIPAPAPISDREKVLEDAVALAHEVFVEYMEQHLAKGAAGSFKAKINLGFATIMEMALAYKAD